MRKMGGELLFRNRCLRPTLFVTTMMMMMWSFVIILVWNVEVGEARLLSAHEQAIGKWDVTLHRKMSPRFFDTVLFPPIHHPSHQQTTIRNKGPHRRMTKPQQARHRRLPKTMDCTLVLRSDGTFVLEPSPSYFHTDDENKCGGIRMMDEVGVEERMGIRGRWKLVPNPYCITDRQYDELTLYSHPRVQWNWLGDTKLKQARLELRCRIWGRYGAKSIRSLMGMSHGRSKARITHGTLLYIGKRRNNTTTNNKNGSQTNHNRRLPEQRRVCASFSARPSRIMTAPHYFQSSSPLSMMEEEETDNETDEFHGELQ